MNASFLEIVQTLSAALGALMTIRGMVNADLNLVAVMRSKFTDGSRRMLAQKNVRIERSLLTIQIVLFLAGLATLFLAPPPYSGSGVPTALERSMGMSTVVTRLAMTISSLIAAYLSYRNWLEERLPPLLTRHSDRGEVVSSQLVSLAKEAASKAGVAASHAQDAASVVEQTASMVEDAANSVQQVK